MHPFQARAFRAMMSFAMRPLDRAWNAGKIFVATAASAANVVRAQSPPGRLLEIFFSLYRYGENLYLTIAELLLINYYLAWTLP